MATSDQTTLTTKTLIEKLNDKGFDICAPFNVSSIILYFLERARLFN